MSDDRRGASVDRWAPRIALLVGLVVGAGATGRWAMASESPAVASPVRAPAAPLGEVEPARTASATGPAGPSGEAEAAKVLVRLLRREGRFAAAKAASERYRRLRLPPSP